MQQTQDPRYHMDEGKWVKEAKEQRQQNGQLHTDDAKENKTAMHQTTRQRP